MAEMRNDAQGKEKFREDMRYETGSFIQIEKLKATSDIGQHTAAILLLTGYLSVFAALFAEAMGY